MKKILFILPAFIIFSSCGNNKKQYTAQEYISWAKRSEKNLVKQKEINGYTFTSRFQPVELLILKHGGTISSQSGIDSVKKIYKGVISMVLNIGSTNQQQSALRANLGSEEEYYQRVYYYTKDAQADLYMLEGRDTLPCVFYHFEQTYDLTPVNSMIMEFERKNPEAPFEDLTLIYQDKILNTGMLKFLYKKSFLNNLPELKL